MIRNSINLFLCLLAITTAGICQEASTNFTIESAVELNGKALEEASGLVASRKNIGYIWTHNDGGDAPNIYLINAKGEIKLTVLLQNAKNVDWEDIAYTYSPETNKGVLYIGDIGDNKAVRDHLTVYKIEEPLLDSSLEKSCELQAQKMQIRYKEGARDAETLLFDPETKQLIIVTKRDEKALVYSFQFEPEGNREIASAGLMAKTGFTGGDINKNGDILLKNYTHIFLWKSDLGRSIVHNLISNAPLKVDYKVEPQGEAIGWDVSDTGFYTLSELNEPSRQLLFHYVLKD
jgi:hypothetical protein